MAAAKLAMLHQRCHSSSWSSSVSLQDDNAATLIQTESNSHSVLGRFYTAVFIFTGPILTNLSSDGASLNYLNSFTGGSGKGLQNESLAASWSMTEPTGFSEGKGGGATVSCPNEQEAAACLLTVRVWTLQNSHSSDSYGVTTGGRCSHKVTIRNWFYLFFKNLTGLPSGDFSNIKRFSRGSFQEL